MSGPGAGPVPLPVPAISGPNDWFRYRSLKDCSEWLSDQAKRSDKSEFKLRSFVKLCSKTPRSPDIFLRLTKRGKT